MNALAMHIIHICIVIWGWCLRNAIRQSNEPLRLSLSVFLQYMQMSKYEYLLHVSCVLTNCRLQKIVFLGKADRISLSAHSLTHLNPHKVLVLQSNGPSSSNLVLNMINRVECLQDLCILRSREFVLNIKNYVPIQYD